MNPAEESPVLLHRCGALLRVTLNDPRRRNALSRTMFDQLLNAIARAGEGDGRPSVVVLAGRGSAFCSGFDLEACASDPQVLPALVRSLAQVTARIRALEAVVVAQVQGAALAGGCALAMACDIVHASSDATFGYPVHRIGVTPAVNLPVLMATGGAGSARHIALSGELLSAAQAQALGLVACVHPSAAELSQAVERLAESLAGKGAGALRSTKAWLNRVDGSAADGPLGSAAARAAEATAELCQTPQARAMLESFWRSRRT